MTEQEQFHTALVRAMARRCGLKDPDAFAAKTEADRLRRVAEAEAMYGSGNVISTPNGRTGRTTRMLLQALVALSSGCEVEVVAADKASAYAMAEQIEALRTRSGAVDQGTLSYGLRVSWVGQGAQTERNIGVRLVDHACEQAFLVHEVGFTPAQADDATSGDIDRNGAASMLPGVIEALEQRGIPPYDEDELLESGVDTAAGHGTDKHRPGLVLTALKLLARARAAEAKVQATIAVQRKSADAHYREVVASATAGVNMLSSAYLCQIGDLLGVEDPVNMIERIESIVARHNDLDAQAIDPTVAALAVVDDLFANGFDIGDLTAPDGRRLCAERLAKVISSVVRRDIKPENLWPLWCAFETDPRSETAFHGPRDTKALAEVEAAALRAEGYAVDVRRCRRVTVTNGLAWWAAEQLVEHVNEDTTVLTDVDGATCFGDWESEIARLREAIDARVEIKLWLVEPEGATL